MAKTFGAAAALSALDILAALVTAQALPALPVPVFLGAVDMTVGAVVLFRMPAPAWPLELQKVSTEVFGACNPLLVSGACGGISRRVRQPRLARTCTCFLF